MAFSLKCASFWVCTCSCHHFCFVQAASMSSGSIDAAPSMTASVVAFRCSFSKIMAHASESSRQNLSGRCPRSKQLAFGQIELQPAPRELFLQQRQRSLYNIDASNKQTVVKVPNVQFEAEAAETLDHGL